MRAARVFLGAVAALALGALGCGRQAPQTVDAAKLKMFAPLPDVVPAKAGAPAEAQVTLGRMLYYEPRLSKGQDVSCNTCHNLTRYGVDGEPTSEGFKKQHGNRNSPTVYNAAAHFVQFWDGRAPDVEAQAKGPVMNPVEMAMPSEKAVAAVLKSMPEYVAAFQRAFPGEKDPVTLENAAKAIGAFERGLLTPARWDKFLKGDETALTPEEKAGFNTFVAAGCQACHAGTLLGGNLYQKIGTVKPYPDTSDEGRFQVTKSDADKMTFKVPSLRNVEKTGPYFHNGKIPTLDAAIVQMAEYQLGKQLSDAEVRSIGAFLKTLTGDIPAEYIKPPELPKSTAKTPKPDLAD
ncbi:MAG TPA: cytochrome c peroxidase [Bryobacteraceae bacterium]|nr:cytochrome c peroxidase [Bryobacteraceae bacterium]